MMQEMMNTTGMMGVGVGLTWLLIVVVLALGIAALAKYLFFER